MPHNLDLNLRPYATDRQWDLFVALCTHGSIRKAAKVMGCHYNTVEGAKVAIKKKAALGGYMPDNVTFGQPAPGPITPPGFVLKGQSARIDESGQMQQRWDKTKQAGRDPEEVIHLPDPKTIVKLSTLYDQEGNVTQQWVAEKPDAVAQAKAWEEFAKALTEDIPRIKPTKAPKTDNSSLMTCYPIGDHHMGMLSWDKETGDDYDLVIGEELLTGAIEYLIGASPDCEEATVVFLGDFMHYDSFEPVTPTSRNQLDADSRFPKMVRASIRTMRYAIERALKKHKHVYVIVEIGNHDLSSSIFLMECLSNVYENEPRVTVDTSPMHYHYFKFGQCLVGIHHGHGANMKDLPLIMASDKKEWWGETKYRYWWTGHIHNRKTYSADDFAGCSVESFRVLPPVDAWARQKGYRSHRDMKSIILHKDYGEVARNTVTPEMVR